MKKLLLALLVCSSALINGGAQDTRDFRLKHVEPPHWFAGMAEPVLQIMLHGPDIGLLDPSVNHPGIRLDSTVRVPNRNYIFLYLTTLPDVAPGTFRIDLKLEGKVRQSLDYRILPRSSESAKRKGFNPSDVICLVMPDRFANGNPENDRIEGYPDQPDRGFKGGRHGGDLRGILDHLDYFQDMGYTAIWLNPVLENNQKSFSYHGYSTTDYYRIDPRLGTLDDYLELSQQAGIRGIKLIKDMVMNHCGSGHWWVNDLPAPDWFHHGLDFTPTNHRRTTLLDPHAAKSDREAFTDGWFVPTMPDLNPNNRLLGDYLIQNSIWWIETAGLSGIRHDTHPYAGKPFMSRWTCRIMHEYPDFSIVGEEWSENPAIVATWQAGNALSSKPQSCLKSLMDFPLQLAVTKALNEPESHNSGWIRAYEMLANDFVYPDPSELVIFLDNHDIDRIATQLNGDDRLVRMGLAYLLTMRGIPQVYYGTEILMQNAVKGDDGLRRGDFPGGWSGDSVNVFTGKGLSPSQRSTRDYLKGLLLWRKAAGAVHNGELIHYVPDKGLYVYFRFNRDQKVMVLLNKADSPVSVVPEKYPEMLAGSASGTEVISGETKVLREWMVPAKSALILEIR